MRDTIEVPFNFEIDTQGKLFFLNGAERFEAGTLQIQGGSVWVPLDQFDNQLTLRARKNHLEGYLHKQGQTEVIARVLAEKNKTHRFEESRVKPAADISGKYEVWFAGADGRPRPAIALLQQEGEKLTGTFQRPSGDSRYLEGKVDGNQFYLSAFIGYNPVYFRGSFTGDGKINGEQVGLSSNQQFSGVRNEQAALPVPPSGITTMKEGRSVLPFSFPDIQGRQVSPTDEKYRNKVVVVVITGTWCPNCMDEVAFLAPWYRKNRQRGVEIIAIHYERQRDPVFVEKVMTRIKNRYGIDYDQVFGGIAQVDSVSRSLPDLENFSSFPTTILLNKKGAVARIHTGYSGPATGALHENFISTFNREIDELLAE